MYPWHFDRRQGYLPLDNKPIQYSTPALFPFQATSDTLAKPILESGRAIAMVDFKDQQHPLWNTDRQLVSSLLGAEPTDLHLAELARLRVRYQGFPGARDIQTDLDKILKRWQLTEAQLFEKTRQIHAEAQVYRGRTSKRDDWS